jgi:hypothetical protein
MNKGTTPQKKPQQIAPMDKPAQLDKFYKELLKGFGYDYQRSTSRG